MPFPLMSAGSWFIEIGWVKPSLIIKDANMLASEAFSHVAVPADWLMVQLILTSIHLSNPT